MALGTPQARCSNQLALVAQPLFKLRITHLKYLVISIGQIVIQTIRLERSDSPEGGPPEGGIKR